MFPEECIYVLADAKGSGIFFSILKRYFIENFLRYFLQKLFISFDVQEVRSIINVQCSNNLTYSLLIVCVSSRCIMLLFADIGIQSSGESMSTAQSVTGSGIEEQAEFDEGRAENGFSDGYGDDDDDDDKLHLAIRFAPQDKTICKSRNQIYQRF